MHERHYRQFELWFRLPMKLLSGKGNYCKSLQTVLPSFASYIHMNVVTGIVNFHCLLVPAVTCVFVSYLTHLLFTNWPLAEGQRPSSRAGPSVTDARYISAPTAAAATASYNVKAWEVSRSPAKETGEMFFVSRAYRNHWIII